MSSGIQSFLVNDNPQTKDFKITDTFIDHHIFENVFLKYRSILERNLIRKVIDSRYDFRPDLLAFNLYGEDFWYPAILIVNDLGSMFQFKADYLNHECLVPAAQDIQEVILKINTNKDKNEAFN